MTEHQLPNRLHALKTVPDDVLGECIENYYKKALENCSIKELEDEMKSRVEAKKMKYQGEMAHWEPEAKYEPKSQAGLKEIEQPKSEPQVTQLASSSTTNPQQQSKGKK